MDLKPVNKKYIVLRRMIMKKNVMGKYFIEQALVAVAILLGIYGNDFLKGISGILLILATIMLFFIVADEFSVKNKIQIKILGGRKK